MSLFDPDVTYEDMNLPDHVGETYHGHAGVVRAAERWTEPFEWLVVELEEIIDAGDHLFSFHRWRAKARHTGIEINERLAYRWIGRPCRDDLCVIGNWSTLPTFRTLATNSRSGENWRLSMGTAALWPCH